MRNILSWLACLLPATLSIAADPAQSTKQNFPKSVSLQYQDLSSSSSNPLLTVEYDPKTLDYVLISWTPPSLDSLKSISPKPQSAPLLRVLLPEGAATVTSLSTFDPKLSQDIDLWLSRSTGDVISASVRSSTPPPLSKEEELQRQKEERLRKRGKAVPSKPVKQSKTKAKKAKEAVVGEVQAGPVVRVNLLMAENGPSPQLLTRQPPEVDAQGNEIVQEPVQEKTFLQKYWYLLLGLAFILITNGGGKE